MEADAETYADWADDRREGAAAFHADEPIPEDHVLVVSTGLIEALPDAELRAVLAHEVAHLRNADLRFVNWLLFPVFWADELIEGAEADRLKEVFAAFVRLITGELTRFVSLVGVAVFTRGREFAADAGSARLTGDPAALASALERLSETTGEAPTRDLRAVGVVNVLPGLSDRDRGLLSTHPPTEARIQRLREMVAESET